MNKKLYSSIVILVSFIPNLSFASVTDVDTLLQKILTILNNVIPILLALAFIYFVWGIISYIFSKDENNKKQGKQNMIWGIIALFVIFSVWGLVAILQNTFGIDETTNILPQLPSIDVN